MGARVRGKDPRAQETTHAYAHALIHSYIYSRAHAHTRTHTHTHTTYVCTYVSVQTQALDLVLCALAIAGVPLTIGVSRALQVCDSVFFVSVCVSLSLYFMCTHVYAWMPIFMYGCMGVCNVCVHIYIYMDIYIYIHTHTHIYTRRERNTHMCIHV